MSLPRQHFRRFTGEIAVLSFTFGFVCLALALLLFHCLPV